MTRSRILAVAALVSGVLLGGFATAQDDAEYPHGDFDGDCSRCHSDDGWSSPVLEPSFRDEHPFALTRAHDLEDCRACHVTLDFTLASPACVDCHLDVHRGEFGTDCSECHTPRTFIDPTRMLRSHQLTRFPLRGTHRALDCEACHALEPPGALRWVNTPSRCVDCHRDDYQGNAQHVADGFPLECDACHAPTVWADARFDHTGIVSGCAGCHLDDYRATDDPNHVAAGFPTTCEDCHTPTTWSDAEFDHRAFFPIESGEHAGQWDRCSTCHVNPSSFSTFSCFGCHPHSDRDATDSDHSGVGGYSYDSGACYACHPDGRS